KTDVDTSAELPVKQVMIVDDEAYNRKLLRSILTKYGVDTIEAENGQEALDLLDQHEPELILLDARMPVMDGHETIKRVRQGRHKDIKVIVLTAAVSAKDRSSFEAEGAD